jgi:hypothetical protein
MSDRLEDKNYMIFAKMRSGLVRPVVLGLSPNDCIDHLSEAVSEWTKWDLRQLDECWFSRWNTKSKIWVIMDGLECPRSLIGDIVKANVTMT